MSWQRRAELTTSPPHELARSHRLAPLEYHMNRNPQAIKAAPDRQKRARFLVKDLPTDQRHNDGSQKKSPAPRIIMRIHY